MFEYIQIMQHHVGVNHQNDVLRARYQGMGLGMTTERIRRRRPCRGGRVVTFFLPLLLLLLLPLLVRVVVVVVR